jgi:hypothetical protein
LFINYITRKHARQKIKVQWIDRENDYDRKEGHGEGERKRKIELKQKKGNGGNKENK